MVDTHCGIPSRDQSTQVDAILFIVVLPIQTASQNLCPQLTVSGRFDLLMDDLHKILQGDSQFNQGNSLIVTDENLKNHCHVQSTC